MKETKSYRDTTTVSDAFHVMKVILGILINLLLAITTFNICLSTHSLIAGIFAAIAVTIDIVLAVYFIKCYHTLQNGKHVGKESRYAKR